MRIRSSSTDLVIIGGGGAGLASAVAAAEKGVRRIKVLEKRGLGGTSVMAGGIFAAESPVQMREEVHCSRDRCFKVAMDFAHWRINPRIVRAFIDKSSDTIRWLEAKGLSFRLLRMYPNQIPTWHVPQGLGAELIHVLIEECKKLGVELCTHTPARKISRNDKDGAISVWAIRDGKELEIKTRSVIIATGGYGGNKRLLQKYCSYYTMDMGMGRLPHMGDGLTMAAQIGAAIENQGTLLLSGPDAPGTYIKMAVRNRDIRFPMMAVTLEPYSVWVNKNGKRFADESIGYSHFVSSHAVIRQPGKVCYCILDSKMIQTMEERGFFLGMGDPEGTQGNKLPGLGDKIRALEGQNIVKVSNSWQAIAKWIGAEYSVLMSTIDEYNRSCDHGHDQAFAKDRIHLWPLRTPPYYCIKSRTSFLNTIGGIRIDEYMQVLDGENNPIPGIYAAGVDTGGWESEVYCCELSGSAFGFAINSGRIAGEGAANLVKLQRLHGKSKK